MWGGVLMPGPPVSSGNGISVVAPTDTRRLHAPFPFGAHPSLGRRAASANVEIQGGFRLDGLLAEDGLRGKTRSLGLMAQGLWVRAPCPTLSRQANFAAEEERSPRRVVDRAFLPGDSAVPCSQNSAPPNESLSVDALRYFQGSPKSCESSTVSKFTTGPVLD